MSQTLIFGLIEDGKEYTHKTLAQIHGGMEPQWAIDTFVFPTDENGEPIPGVPYYRRGALYVMSGLNIRLWGEAQARPSIDHNPDKKKQQRAKKRNGRRSNATHKNEGNQAG